VIRKRTPARLDVVSAVLLVTAATLDLPAMLRYNVASPTITYGGIFAGIGLGCVALAIRLLARHRSEPRPRGALLQLVALGLALGAWLLRGHPEIPADPPLVVAQALAAMMYVGGLLRSARVATATRVDPAGFHLQ
jgi:peptidoglycan/LPS O-acetylase OafA/YrhL